MGREALGQFEQQVLLAILRLGGNSYSAPIVVEMEERGDRDVAPAAVYIALRRLEKRGLLTSRKEQPDAQHGGRGIRHFAVTPEAVERLKATKRTLESYWEGLEPIMEE